MIRWREILLIGGLFVLLILFTLYGPGRLQNEPDGRRGSTHSIGEDGALALQRWLQALGYQAGNLEYEEWSIPEEAQALFILNAVEKPILDAEAQQILEWVRAGGTLIAIDERPQLAFAPNRLWQVLEATTVISVTDNMSVAERATATQPLLASPPVTSVAVHTNAALTLEAPNYVSLLQTQFGPSLIGRQEGRGYIYLGIAAHPFTNGGLREPGSAGLVLNLLAGLPREAVILFDEYHHGYASAAAAAPSLQRIVLSTWWGWALVYSIGVGALYLVLSGRRFGRPVPLRQDLVRRSSAEYVQSLAQLLQRAGRRQHIAGQLHDTLKRRVARQHGLVATATDDQFISSLFNAGGATNEQGRSLRQLLDQLRRPDLGDADLVRLVRASDKLIDRRGRLR
jgi:hypothetical protein